MADLKVDSYKSSFNQPVQHGKLPVDEVSTKEQLKLLCKLTYKMRRVKTKGAILVLIWNFLALFVLWYATNSQYRTTIPNNEGGKK